MSELTVETLQQPVESKTVQNTENIENTDTQNVETQDNIENDEDKTDKTDSEPRTYDDNDIADTLISSDSDSENNESKKTRADKRKGTMARMTELRQKRSKARKLNREAVQEEDRLSKLPANHEARQMRAQWKLEDIGKREDAKEAGEDYQLLKLREMQADHAEARAVKKKTRADPDQGWTSWADCTARTYRKGVKEIVPDWRAYQSEKQRLGDDAFYATMNTQVETQRKDHPNAKNKLSEAIATQQEKRSKFHRRRAFNEDDHINFINERNRKFNLKAERAYGAFTANIRDNIERGTSL